MIRIAIPQAAYESIERRLALGTVACGPQPNKNGERLIWLEELGSTSSIPSGSPPRVSEAIIRLATLWEGHWTHKRR
jgi:hypothetical protein